MSATSFFSQSTLEGCVGIMSPRYKVPLDPQWSARDENLYFRLSKKLAALQYFNCKF